MPIFNNKTLFELGFKQVVVRYTLRFILASTIALLPLIYVLLGTKGFGVLVALLLIVLFTRLYLNRLFRHYAKGGVNPDSKDFVYLTITIILSRIASVLVIILGLLAAAVGIIAYPLGRARGTFQLSYHHLQRNLLGKRYDKHNR